MNGLKTLLVLLVSILDKVVDSRKLTVLSLSDYPRNFELFRKTVKYCLHSEQICLIFLPYQCQLLIQSVLNMFLDLLAGHHIVIHLENDIVNFLAELVVEVVSGVSVAPAHALEVCGLLGEVRSQVLLHPFNQLLQLLLLLRQVLVRLRYRS